MIAEVLCSRDAKFGIHRGLLHGQAQLRQLLDIWDGTNVTYNRSYDRNVNIDVEIRCASAKACLVVWL